MHPFSLPQHFDPVHVPLQFSLKLYLAMNSLPSLFLILHLLPRTEFLFFSLYNPPHSSPYMIILSLWLTVTTPYFIWIRHPFLSSTLMDIRLYHASGTYRIASRACTVSSLSVILTISLDDLVSRAIHHPDSPFLLCN